MKLGRIVLYKVALPIVVTAVTVSCNSPEKISETAKPAATDSASMHSSSNKLIVYQVMTRLFGNKTSLNKRYGTAAENGVGKFNDITAEALREIKELGSTHIWYTGVIEHATMTDFSAFGIPLDDADVVKGRAGSPYAIKDYYDVNPDLATDIPKRMEEFEALVERTHDAGLKVLIDFVPNHVARRYTSDAKPEGIADFGAADNTAEAFNPGNNFYYIPGQPFQVPAGYDPLPRERHPSHDRRFEEIPAKATGNDVFSATPSIHDWFETVKLNYGVDYQNNREKYFDPVPDTWHKMYDILSYWASKGVDGFRCDMAEMVPVEFWEWVIPKIKERFPQMLFVAEIYKPNEYRDYLFRGKFDYLYDKVELYDTLRHIVEGKANTDHITPIWQRQEGIGHLMLRFLENHDEQRIASPFFAGRAEYAIPAMALTAFMHTGPVMVYFGQEVGEPGAGNEGFQGEDGRTTIFDYWGVPSHQAWMNNGKFDGGKLTEEQRKLRDGYKKILHLCKGEELINEGSFYDLHFFNRSDSYKGYSNNIYTFLRHNDTEAILIAANFNKTATEKPTVKIPLDALEKFGMGTSAAITFTVHDNANDKQQIAVGDLSQQNIENKGFTFDIAPNTYRIFRLTSN